MRSGPRLIASSAAARKNTISVRDWQRGELIQPGKDQTVCATKGLSLRRMPSQYVNLMPEDQDLGCQRRSRPEQPDQRRPDKAASFLHRTERLRDSASIVSPIEFTITLGGRTHGAADKCAGKLLAIRSQFNLARSWTRSGSNAGGPSIGAMCGMAPSRRKDCRSQKTMPRWQGFLSVILAIPCTAL